MGSAGTFSLTSVCRLTGLNEHTLRAWERRYKAVRPQRLPNGRRFYSSSDVQRLKILVSLVAEGHAISAIADLSAAELTGLSSNTQALAVAPVVSETQSGPRAGRSSFEPAVRRLLAAVDAMDLAIVQEELLASRSRLSMRAFALGLISTIMGQVANLLEKGRITIAQEHALSALVRTHLLDMLFQLNYRARTTSPQSPNDVSRNRIACATIDGDYHEIGILIGGLLCAEASAQVSYFGASMPAAPLAQAAAALRADVVLCSMIHRPHGSATADPGEFLQDLAGNLPPRCEIWIGADLCNYATQALLDGGRTIQLFPRLHDLAAHLDTVRRNELPSMPE